jgi:serine protease Do
MEHTRNTKWRKSTVLTFSGSVALAALCLYAVAQAPKPERTFASLPEVTPRVMPASTVSGTENLAALKEMDNTLANLAEFVSPAVVHIRAESNARSSDMLGQQMPSMGGQGSGVIYRPDGYIVTNDHVVGGFDKVTVILEDGRELPGKVISAGDIDIAVVKVDAKDLPTLPFGDSSMVKPGQFSIAVGSPFGLENTVTVGHISALGRTNSIYDPRISREREYPDLIQTDAAINMGNSGGPLINVDGQVIGINTAIFSANNNGGSNGIGFAIPSNSARLIADRLIEGKKVERGALGLVPQTVKKYELKSLGIEGGARVTNVQNGHPAAMAGLKDGDIVLRIGEQKILSETDLRNSMLRYGPGQKVEVEVLRGTDKKELNVTLTSLSKMRESVMQQERRSEPRQDEERENPFDFNIPEEWRRRFEGRDDNKSEEIPQGRARLGVTVQTLNPGLLEQFSIPRSAEGVVVIGVVPGSVAAEAGLKEGDVLREIDNEAVESVEDLRKAISGKSVGDRVTVMYTRYSKGGEHTEVKQITLK